MFWLEVKNVDRSTHRYFKHYYIEGKKDNWRNNRFCFEYLKRLQLVSKQKKD